jgi:hypothetical protein
MNHKWKPNLSGMFISKGNDCEESVCLNCGVFKYTYYYHYAKITDYDLILNNKYLPATDSSLSCGELMAKYILE